MYRIRFHGRGGQGIKTASRILGEAFFLTGFEVQDAPRYGAERRGAPIFAYVRASRTPINERGVIARPDLVIVADESLVPLPAASALQGITERAILLINSTIAPTTWHHRLNIQGRILILSFEAVALDRLSSRFRGAACVGAAARLIGVIDRETLEEAVRQELSPLGKEILDIDLSITLDAFSQMDPYAGMVTEGEDVAARDYQVPDWIDLPFDEARVAAPAIHAPATSIALKTGLWRTLRPVIDASRCNRCWWICSTFCPDGAISLNEEQYPQIDYEHCKGCMVCVAQCPTHAIEVVPEQEAAIQEGGGRRS